MIYLQLFLPCPFSRRFLIDGRRRRFIVIIIGYIGAADAARKFPCAPARVRM
jgi:hypothetical protein